MRRINWEYVLMTKTKMLKIIGNKEVDSRHRRSRKVFKQKHDTVDTKIATQKRISSKIFVLFVHGKKEKLNDLTADVITTNLKLQMKRQEKL